MDDAIPPADETHDDGLLDRLRDMPVGVLDPNIIGDAGPTDIPPGSDPPDVDSDMVTDKDLVADEGLPAGGGVLADEEQPAGQGVPAGEDPPPLP